MLFHKISRPFSRLQSSVRTGAAPTSAIPAHGSAGIAQMISQPWVRPRSTRWNFVATAAAATASIVAHGIGRRRRLHSHAWFLASMCAVADAETDGQTLSRVGKVEVRVMAKVISAFPDSAAEWVTEGHVQRMLCATCGDEALAIAKLKQAVAWKKDVLDKWLAQQADILPTTETRVIAIGQDSRPLVYSGCVNQRKGEVAGILLACVWDQALQKAGPTAKLDYVLDSHGYQPLLNLNIMPYLKVASSIDSYFAERFHRIIVIDMPTVLVWVIQAIMPLLPAKTRAKLYFVNRSDPDQMKALYELCVDQDMREMLVELLQMNKAATSSATRDVTHALTNSFLELQNSRRS